MVTPIKTAVTVNASRKADRMAAEKQNINERFIFELTLSSNFVNIANIKFFMK